MQRIFCKIGVYVSLCLFIISCSRQSKTVFTDVIDVTRLVKKEMQLSDLSETIKYIPLDNRVIVGDINDSKRIKIFDNNIFIWDYKKGLLRFSKDGKFINHIGTIGRGPSEYGQYSAFDINKNSREVYILEDKKFLVFNFDGDYIRNEVIKSDYYLYNIDFISPGSLILATNNSYGESPFNWICSDCFGNILNVKNNYIRFKPPELSSLIPSMITYKFDDAVYYYEQYNDTIFKISNSEIKSAYIFLHDKTRFTPEIFIRDGMRNLSSYYIPRNIIESSKYLIILFHINSKNKLTVLNKKNKNFFEIKGRKNNGIFNDIDGGINFLPLIYNEEENEEYLISVINAFEYKVHVTSDAFKNATPKYPEKKTELEKLANSLDENDNPVLMLVKLKE